MPEIVISWQYIQVLSIPLMNIGAEVNGQQVFPYDD